MATAGPTTQSDPAPAEAAARLRAAPFVGLVGVATGAGLAATGLLAGALRAADVPFQASVGPLADASGTVTGDGDDLTVALGRPDLAADLDLDVDIDLAGDVPVPAVAYDVAAALEDADPSPILALAGLVAADEGSPDRRSDLVEAADLERRPGLGLPVADATEGLADTTLLHTEGSGDPDAIAERFGTAETDDGRTLASRVALAVAADDAPPAAGEAVEAALRPSAGGPFETVAGYADILRALAARAPGLGIQVAMERVGGAGRSTATDEGDGSTAGTKRTAVDADLRERALDHWRAHGEATHAAVAGADLARHDGLVVATAEDDPTWAVARLLRDYVSPEPVVVQRGKSASIATTRGDPGDFATAVETAADATDGRAVVTGRRARVVADDRGADDMAAFVEALRGAI